MDIVIKETHFLCALQKQKPRDEKGLTNPSKEKELGYVEVDIIRGNKNFDITKFNSNVMYARFVDVVDIPKNVVKEVLGEKWVNRDLVLVDQEQVLLIIKQ